MKNTGYIIIALGMVSLSITISLSWVNFYLARLSSEFWPTIFPYLQEMAIPIILSVVCIIMGITLVIQAKKEK